MLLHIIMIKSIHNLRKDMRAHDHALTFVITRKFKEKKLNQERLVQSSLPGSPFC